MVYNSGSIPLWLPECGVAWCGVVWCGVVWCGVMYVAMLCVYACSLCLCCGHRRWCVAVLHGDQACLMYTLWLLQTCMPFDVARMNPMIYGLVSVDPLTCALEQDLFSRAAGKPKAWLLTLTQP